ncbi:MAG: 50S ribosomal protein L17 [Candidatus Omnitrophica bacterium]|nr:50S ribosomal protein L17 [Candidatus Omnitrophota bacterium]
MRHAKAGNRLSRNQSLRKATLRDMARSVFLQERICTTVAKAKEARKLIEKLITLGKTDTLAARRRAFAILCDHHIVSRLFSQTAPRFKSRTGGYTRIIPYAKRLGDNAALVFLELTEKSRTIISGQKRVKAAKEAGDTSKVSEAETKPVAPTAGAAETTAHSKADVKTTPKAAAKPTGVRKLFQRKTGGE